MCTRSSTTELPMHSDIGVVGETRKVLPVLALRARLLSTFRCRLTCRRPPAITSATRLCMPIAPQSPSVDHAVLMRVPSLRVRRCVFPLRCTYRGLALDFLATNASRPTLIRSSEVQVRLEHNCVVLLPGSRVQAGLGGQPAVQLAVAWHELSSGAIHLDVILLHTKHSRLRRA